MWRLCVTQDEIGASELDILPVTLAPKEKSRLALYRLRLRADKDNSVRFVAIQCGAVKFSCMKKCDPRHSSASVTATTLSIECDGHIKYISMCSRLE